MHTLFIPDTPDNSATLLIEGEEARHALRVKRLREGEPVRVLNGRGLIIDAVVTGTGGSLSLAVRARRTAPEISPRLDVWSATPKGPRIAELVEGLAQVGAASWTPMQTRLGVVDPRESKLARLERIVIESCKQCGRAWLMNIGEKRRFEDSLAPGPTVVLADARGRPYSRTGASSIRLLIGPEGGFVPEEIAAAERAGAIIARFGPHAMRIETAAIAATAIVLSAEGEAIAPG